MGNRRRVWTGIALILLGLAILLREWLTLPLGLGVLLILLGGVVLKDRLSTHHHASIFGPLLALLAGIYFVLGPLLLPAFNGRSHLAFSPLLIGIALIITAALRRWRADLLIIGIMFTALGTVFVLRYLHILFSHHLVYLVDTFWPVLLIMGGLALVLNAYLHRESV